MTFTILCKVLCHIAFIHLLSNGGVFLEEKIHIHVKVAGLKAPCHTTNNLNRGGRRGESRGIGEGRRWRGGGGGGGKSEEEEEKNGGDAKR